MTRFEEELLQRATIKSSPFVSVETVLLRAFKYFDLDNSEKVTKRQFINTVLNIGVISFSEDVENHSIRIYRESLNTMIPKIEHFWNISL